ncbi:MAG: cyclic nucleotide-binding domain-containing protein [Nitrospinae bacterium]|nr:cyclic nucleotide-binding domain-containing protein [Nitrospinota bacterium]
MALLNKLDFFKEFTLEEKHELSAHLGNSMLIFRPEEKIIQQGDIDLSVFVLLRGEVVITRDDNPNMVINTLKSGDVFGEISMFEKSPRATNVVAKDQVRVLKLDGECFDKLQSDTRDKFKEALFKLVIKRLHYMNTALIKLKVEMDGFAHANETFRSQMHTIVSSGTTLEQAFADMSETLSKLIHS